jgi:hypothetical protein
MVVTHDQVSVLAKNNTHRQSAVGLPARLQWPGGGKSEVEISVAVKSMARQDLSY